MAGLFDGIEDRVMNPMVMGGLGLAFGGMPGLQSGMQSGMVASRIRKEDRDRAARTDAFNQMFSGDTPEWAKGMSPGILGMARALGPEQGGAMLAQAMMKHPEMELERQKMQAQLALNQSQIGMNNAHTKLFGAQTQKALEGDPMQRMIMEIMRGANGGQPNAAMSPTPSQPGPRLIPQSAPGQMPQPGLQNVADVQGGDPNLIRAQVAQPQQAAPQVPMVNTPMGPMPQDKAKQIGFALALGGKGDAGKMLSESPNALGKEGANENDKRALNALEQSSRLDGIMAKFKPEYQTYETSVKMGANSWLDSFEATRNMVSPADRQKMAEYTQFRQDGMNNLSAYIKEITGAAMGVQEEGRIREGMPDPKKDSPIQFESKMKNSIATTKLALARHSFLKSNGYDDNTISTLAKNDKLGTIHSLDDMKSIINKRLGQAAEQLKAQNPNITPQAMQENLRVIQRREFGI